MNQYSLDPTLRRVLGVLIEKAKTTPGSYPMTVNAIVTGSNQKSNRDPQTSLDDADVMNALHELRGLGTVEELDWLGRVPKYKHLAYEWLSVNRVELAVLGELLLRGPQTMGELRGRAARMEPIADMAELEPIVGKLVERGLMIELTPPGRGQIVSHNLYPPEELARIRTGTSGASETASRDGGSDRTKPPGPSAGAAPDPFPAAGSAVAPPSPQPQGPEIAALRAEVEALRRRVEELEERLGGRAGS